MLKGLQTHFNGSILGPEKCEKLAEIGVQMGRIDAQGEQESDFVNEQIAELAAFGILSYVIVDRPDIISQLPMTVYGVEYMNEPDGRVHPDDYRRGLKEVYVECQHARLDCYGPSVSNLIRSKITADGAELRGIEYIQACQTYPVAMKGSVHRYGDDDQVDNPHKGFFSREHEVVSARYALGYGRPWGCSEFGWASTGTMSEEEAGKNIAWEWRFWEKMMALFAILYQVHSGPTRDRIDNFGLFRFDGSIKESIARTFR